MGVDMHHITYGRYPSLGEVTAYYTRPDFLEFLLRTCAMRRVLMVIPTARHWEPHPEHNRIAGGSQATLRDIILARIADAFPDTGKDERLPFYPSFHQEVERWAPGTVDDGKALGRDGVAEADLSTWREAFLDVRTLLASLREHRIPCLCKFSGHRSLHVLVPYADKHVKPFHFGESQAHSVHLLRMPYSLNEDTGLASLPLTWEELPAFRPWHANLHLVSIGDAWLCEPSPEEREQIHDFFTRIYREMPVPRVAEPAIGLQEMRVRSRQLAPLLPAEDGPPAAAWRQLDEEEVTEHVLQAALVSPDEDVRWLTAESFLLHGDALSSSLIESLVRDPDPYVRAATMDILTRFADVASDYFFTLLQQDDLGQQSRSLYLLAVCSTLRDAVFATIRATAVRTAALTLRLACVTGVVAGDWPLAWRFIAEGETEYAGTAAWTTGTEALKLLHAITSWSLRKEDTLRRLAELGSGALDLLLLCMATPHTKTRWEFLRALSLLADERALDVYIETLGSKYRDSARWATRGLVALGAVAVPALIEAAASDDARVRRYAVRCLGHLGDARGRDAILNTLEDADETVCRQGVVALRRLVTERDITSLQHIMRTCSWQTRREALATLLVLGETGICALTTLALEDGEPVAAGWLWQQGDVRGKDILLQAFIVEGETRHAAILELAHNPADAEVIDIFVQSLPELQWDEQEQVAAALVELHDPKGFDSLLALTAHEHFFARRTAVDALGRWGDPHAIPALIQLFDDPNTKVRRHAGEALTAIGEPARQPLEAALAGTVSNTLQAHARTTLDTLDVIRQAREGVPIDLALLHHSWPSAVQRVATILREQQAAAEYQHLAEHLQHGKSGLRWFARLLLLEIGEDARGAVEAFLAHTTQATAKAEAESLLQELNRRLVQEEND